MTDADIIEAIASGRDEGPIPFAGSVYFAMRISGTGFAYRPKKEEFGYRDPKIWLTPTMCARWSGAPIVVQHPADDILDGESLADQIIGTIVRAFVRGRELWCAARVINEQAAANLIRYGADTSPAVSFPPEAKAVTLKQGDRVFFEPSPTTIDHLALVPVGVWSKGDPRKTAVENGD
jgi:hypothetical protein